jgi:prolyl oligopeptidase PreP (S9A serine peptidase family)
MIIINPAQNWYHDDFEISRNREYDPKINRRIINEDDGFAVTTLDYAYDKNKLISDVDKKDIESCFFHCDNMMYSFSEDMMFVAYVYKNSLYVSRTTKPFNMHMVSTRFDDQIQCVSTTDRTVVVGCDKDVYIFNIINIRE